MRPSSVPLTRALRATIALALVAIAALAGSTVAQAQRNLYVNDTNGSVTGYDMNPATGSLTPIAGSPFASGGYGIGAVVNPEGAFLYAANYTGDNVYAFSIDEATGALTPVSGSPFGVGNGPIAVAVNPAGTFLFVTNQQTNNISVLAIDQSTGELTSVAGSPFSTGSLPLGLAVSPSGDNLYVANTGASTVRAFSIDQADGSLTPIAPYAAGSAPHGVAVDPTGRFLYSTDSSDNSVHGFAIDQADGSLTNLSGSPWAAGSSSREVWINPAGTRLFVVNAFSNDVSSYAIDQSSGALSQVAESPFATDIDPLTMALSPAGNYLYTSGSSSNVSAFAVDGSTGGLSQITGSPFSGVSQPDAFSMAFTPAQAPTADFTATPEQAGSPSEFDGSASTAVDGSVALYEWDFGDGTTASSGTPTTSHTYADGGDYTVRLTVTDEEGCSTELLWQGQSAYCNGSTSATTTQLISVPAAPKPPTPPSPSPTLSLTELRIAPGHFKVNERGPVIAKISKGARIDFKLDADATVRFTLEKRRTGRIVGGRCVKPRRGNRGNRRCAIDYVRAGSFSAPGKSGANSVAFSGKLTSGMLEPGVYRISAKAIAGDRSSDTETRKFKITCPRRPSVCFAR